MARSISHGGDFWDGTRFSGADFEEKVARVIAKYTNMVWHNVRIETLLTAGGSTEIDIIFCLSGFIYVLELKHVWCVEGSYAGKYWSLYGRSGRGDTFDRYTKLNVIVQNNIHAKSLSDLYFTEFRRFPDIIPLIIVPDNCEISDDLATEIFCVSELEDFLASHFTKQDNVLSYQLALLFNKVNGVVQRKDFVPRIVRGDYVVRGRRLKER